MTVLAFAGRHLAGARASRLLLGATIAAGSALLVSCSGSELTAPLSSETPGTPLSPNLPPIGPNGEILVNCSGDLRSRMVTCGGPAGGPTAAAAKDLIVGGQNTYVALAAGAVTTTAGQLCSGAANPAKQCFGFDVTVRNLIPQPMGTTDGVTPVATGLQVFFVSGPTTTGGSGVITLANANGPSFFTASGQFFYQYSGPLLGADNILVTNETSGARTWQLESDASVTTFAFQVYVSAPVPKPDGYVDVALTSGGAPVTTASVDRGSTRPLFATPRSAVGGVIPAGSLSAGVTFASSNTAVATVDPSTGVVSGVANGTATITASATKSSGPTITGTVLVTVTSAAPTTVADAYDVQMGVVLDVTTNNGVLANDTDADDAATALTVTKTSDPIHGTVRLNADGTFTYVPTAGYSGGSDSFTYTVSDGSTTSAPATVTLTVSGRTWWVNGAYTGTPDGTQRSPFLTLANAEVVALAGDTIFTSGTGSASGATLKASQAVIGAGIPASITRHLNATPASQAQDIVLLASRTSPAVNGALALAADNTLRGVTITAASGSAISGTSFGTLTVSATNASATAGPVLSLSSGTVAASFGTLSSSGSATTALSLNAVNGSLSASGGTLTGATGSTISVIGGSVSVTHPGTISRSAVGALLSVTGGHSGTLTFAGAVSATNGTGLQFDNADGTYAFSGTTTLNGGDAGIDIANGSAGTFTFSASSSITNPTAEVLRVNASSPTVTYAGSFTKSGGSGSGIVLSDNTGGTISITGSGVTKSLSTGSSVAVALTSNTGATVAFTNGGLAITTTSGNGFSATSGGTVSVTGTGNTIAASGGVPLNVTSTTIGASGLTFQRIDANGGSNGIVLTSTGTSGGLTVTGAGSAGSGGTIQNTSGANGAVAGNGVYLSGARNVSVSWMSLSGHSNHAIYGAEVTGFALDKTRITGTNGTTVGTIASGGGVYFDNLYGTASISNSTITGGAIDNVHIFNGLTTAASAALDRITFSGDTIFGNGTYGGTNINLAAYQSSVMKATVQNSIFTSSRASTINFATNQNSSGDVVISDNTITNSHPNQVSGTTGIFVGNASTGGLTYRVTNNSVNGVYGSGIEVDRAAGGAGSMDGSVTGNRVGTAGVSGSGSRDGSAIFIGLVQNSTGAATHTNIVSGNVIRQFGNYGIKVLNSGAGGGYLDVRMTANIIGEPSTTSPGFPTGGIRFDLGVSSGPPSHDGRTCAVITGNTVTNAGTNGGEEIRIRGRFATRTGIPGVGADPNAFIAANNTIVTSGIPVAATSTTAFQSSCPPL